MHDTIDAEPTSGGALAVPIPGPTRIDHAIEAAREWLLARQHEAGFWCGELEGDTTLESYPILLEAFLGRRDSEQSRASGAHHPRARRCRTAAGASTRAARPTCRSRASATSR